MANDAALRSCLVCLAAILVVVAIYTQSFKKIAVTYAVGVLGIAGVVLPDWCYFDRDFSRWTSPVSAEERASYQIASTHGFRRLRNHPMRLAVYTTVYGFGLYKWWNFISN